MAERGEKPKKSQKPVPENPGDIQEIPKPGLSISALKDVVAASGITPAVAEASARIQEATGIKPTLETARQAAELDAPMEHLPSPASIGEVFAQMGESWEKLMDALAQIFGGGAAAKVFDAAPKKFEPEKVEKALAEEHARNPANPARPAEKFDPSKYDEYGKRIYAIWHPDMPKSVMAWFCQIKKIPDSQGRKDAAGNPIVYFADSNGVQSFGEFQLNNGLLHKFLAHVRNRGGFFDDLSPETRRKVESIAGSPPAGQRKGEHHNFLTTAEGRELVEKVFRRNPWLERNFRGEFFFNKELVPTLAKIRKEFPQQAAFCDTLSIDQRYLAVILDVSNQCGPGGARGMLRYVFRKISSGGGAPPSPEQGLRLLMEGSSAVVSGKWKERRAMRTFFAFTEASGAETGIDYRKLRPAVAAFLSGSANEQLAILDRFKKNTA